MAASNGQKATQKNVVDLVFRSMLMAIIGWLVHTESTNAHQNEALAVIEATRFTAQDGRELLDVLLTRLPPDWLREDILEIKEVLQRQDVRLDAIEKKIGNRQE